MMVRHLFALVTALALTGCAGPLRVDNTVNSYARWDATPTGSAAPTGVPQGPQRYRFERLPSQKDDQATEGQSQLEALTRSVLEARDWTLADAAASARWAVQVSASTVRTGRDPWDDPWGGWLFRGHVVAGNGHLFFSPMFTFPREAPSYQRQVALLVRDADTGRVVYETRADHDSRWNSSPALWQSMLDAALKDFPAPPAGPRRVVVELPR